MLDRITANKVLLKSQYNNIIIIMAALNTCIVLNASDKQCQLAESMLYEGIKETESQYHIK